MQVSSQKIIAILKNQDEYVIYDWKTLNIPNYLKGIQVYIMYEKVMRCHPHSEAN